MRPAKLLNSALYGPEVGLRPRTELPRWVINLIFNDGGMGDFVNYTGATLWIAKNCPWIDARIYCPRYLRPLVEDIHANYRHVRVFDSETAPETLEDGTSIIGPSIMVMGRNTTPQLLTCMGAHPFDVGFAYFAHTCPAPADAHLPVLDYPKERLLPKVKRLNGDYAVVPVGNQAPARRTTGKHLNPIVNYIKELGLTPVFLGKRDLLGDGVTTSTYVEDLDYEAGVDLRDQTSVKDAACIMQHAKFTVGLDCGLLHIAALMKDSRIVFGYNITTVEHRVPRRVHGRCVNVAITPQELECAQCQSRLKNMAVHKFDRCLYGDTKCIDLLFGGDGLRFKRAITEVLA
jgi:hypothetical protein